MAASATPSVVSVLAAATKLTVALGATAPAHSTSSDDYTWSPVIDNPGSGPLTMKLGSLLGRLNSALKD